MKIFITGISSGIGRDLSKILVSEGHEVWGIARRQALLETLSLEIGEERFHYDRCDITRTGDVQAVCGKMQRRGFLPEVIFLNAALDLDDDYPHLSVTQAKEMLRTNIEGAFVWVSAFIEPFTERGSGQFIAVSSLFSNWPDKSSVAYSASKAGLSMLFRGLRLRYSNSRVVFKTVFLGPVDTGINPRFKADAPEKRSILAASSADTAEFLNNTMTRRKLDFYHPFYIRVLFQTLKWLPDRVFEALTQNFRR